MVKNLVRLALANEFSRRPIKREDITKKVMGMTAGRQQFKHVFHEANEQLRTVFGMVLTELPAREKITVSQKRAAQRLAGNRNPDNTQSQAAAVASSFVNSSSSSSKQYILTSTLPSRYRTPAILPPAQIPTGSSEASYTGLVSFIVSLIYLSPGTTISETRLERHLKRLNADQYALGEKTDRGVLTRMQREGYIIKARERDGGGEETVDFVVGPRGKVEIAETGVAGLIRKVYGKENAEADELERRLIRSLGEDVAQKVEGEPEISGRAASIGAVEGNGASEPSGNGIRRRSGERRREVADEGEEEDNSDGGAEHGDEDDEDEEDENEGEESEDASDGE